MGRLQLRFDKHTLGNLLKNASPLLSLTPAGPLGSAFASATGDALRGQHDLKRVGLSALTNAGIGKAGSGLVRGALAPHAITAPSALTPNLPVAPAPIAGLTPSVSELASAPGTGASIASPITGSITRGIGGTVRNALTSVTDFAKSNPTATAMGLQAIGGLSTAGAENRRNDAQTRLLEQEYGFNADERRRRLVADEAAEPLRLALAGRLGQTLQLPSIMPPANPYAMNGGA